MYEETKNINTFSYYDFINKMYEIICGMYSAYDELIQRELGIDEEDGIFLYESVKVSDDVPSESLDLSDTSKDGSNKDEE